MDEGGSGASGRDLGLDQGVDVRVPGAADAAILAAAEVVAASAGAAIAARGRFLLALAGGATPRPLYRHLAAPPWRERIDWTRTHLLWSDERCVPPDHADSNYRMAREALIDHVPIPPAQVHRMRGEDDPAAAAAAYEAEVRALVGPPPATREPRGLDLVLLGLGADGHTASLFPARPAGREDRRWVVADQDPVGRPRLTLTPPAINAARTVVVLVIGADKAGALTAVLDGDHDPDRLPAQRVAPRPGRLVWIADTAAAAHVHAGPR